MSEPIDFSHLPNLSHEEMMDLVRSAEGFVEEEVVIEAFFTEADADAAQGEKELRKAIDGFPPLATDQPGEAGE